jgi:SAM-dependent methyltransferase
MDLDEGLLEEAKFADHQYQKSSEHCAEISTRMFSKYSSPVQMWDWRQRAAALLGEISGRSILDYGCGMGEESAYFALLGAHVTAIDISSIGIELTQKRAKLNGLSDRVNAFVGNAIATDFEAESFDIVHGIGILHHVGLRRGLEEVHRLLKTGGRAVFLEPMGNSYFIESCKHRIHQRFGRTLELTPVTSGEENLRLREVRSECARFRIARFYPYHLTYRVRKLILPRAFYETSLKFDFHLLRILPFLAFFAGAVVIYLEK